MRIVVILMASGLATPVFAHVGHLGEVAGHDHWIALGGLAIAAGIAVFGARKKLKLKKPDDEAPDVEEKGKTV